MSAGCSVRRPVLCDCLPGPTHIFYSYLYNLELREWHLLFLFLAKVRGSEQRPGNSAGRWPGYTLCAVLIQTTHSKPKCHVLSTHSFFSTLEFAIQLFSDCIRESGCFRTFARLKLAVDFWWIRAHIWWWEGKHLSFSKQQDERTVDFF